MGPDMRKTFCGAAAVVALFLAGEANAQFANRSLGAGLNFYKLFSSTEDWALPLTLEGSLYIENGFDVFVHVPVMIVNTRVGAPTASGAGLIFGTGAHLGVRYLFMEEELRPYVGLQLSALVLVKSLGPEVFGGPGLTAGIDYFIADTVSLGGRVFYDLFIQLNQPLRQNLGLGVNVATYF
jgi:outer membrane protein